MNKTEKTIISLLIILSLAMACKAQKVFDVAIPCNDDSSTSVLFHIAIDKAGQATYTRKLIPREASHISSMYIVGLDGDFKVNESLEDRVEMKLENEATNYWCLLATKKASPVLLLQKAKKGAWVKCSEKLKPDYGQRTGGQLWFRSNCMPTSN